jgi:hypothetical protein
MTPALKFSIDPSPTKIFGREHVCIIIQRQYEQCFLKQIFKFKIVKKSSVTLKLELIKIQNHNW